MRSVRLVVILLLTVGIAVAFIAANQGGYLDFNDTSTRADSAAPQDTQDVEPSLIPLPVSSAQPSATATPTNLPSSTPTLVLSPTPSATSLPTPVGQAGSWTLVFDDEFSGSAINLEKWTTCYWWAEDGCTNGSSGELEWYQPENVLVQDNRLILRALKKTIHASDGNTHPYTSGMVSSGWDSENSAGSAMFAFQYGYVEMRAKVPAGKGLWPAFWMLPVTQKSLPEIDIMEVLGDSPNVVEMHIHSIDGHGKELDDGINWRGADFSSDWHTFAIDWQPGAIVWYIDGIERWRYTDQKSIPAEPMYLILNLAVGGTWPGNPDASTNFPSDFAIDYVRVWSHQ
jgi:beta-glucanase (GH16 family)